MSQTMPIASATLEETPAPSWDTSPARPLKVLQVIASVAEVNGGASTAIWATLKALRLQGIQAELVTTNEDGPDRLMDVPLGKFIERDGHRVLFHPSRGDRYTTSWPLAKWLFAHVRDYDLVHVHGLFRFAPVAAAHIALARGVPYILTPHNTLGKWGMRYRRPLLKKLSMGLVEGRMLDGAGRVHLCSADELSQASRVRPLGDRSRIFPLGIEPPKETEDRSESNIGQLRETLAGRPIVLFMSRIHEIKGLDQLLTAFAAVRRTRPDAALVIAGTGEAQLVVRMQDMARQFGIADQTHWLGFVSGRPKQELLSMASVFVLPSHSENFGYAVVEALFAGIPTITTTHVPSGEFVTAASAGIVYDGSIERLEQGILQILNMSDEQRRSLGARGVTVVQEQLSLPTFGRSLEQIYREVLGR